MKLPKKGSTVTVNGQPYTVVSCKAVPNRHYDTFVLSAFRPREDLRDRPRRSARTQKVQP